MKKLALTALLILLVGCNNEVEKEEDIFYIDYFKTPRMAWQPESVDRYKFSYELIDRSITLYSIPDFNYEWGYQYKVSGKLEPFLEYANEFTLYKVISKEKVFQPFTLSYMRTSTIVDNVVNFKEEPLIKKISANTYLTYSELEFEVYYQDLIEELDLRLEHNKTVTLTFNFEDNGTIYLQEILEN